MRHFLIIAERYGNSEHQYTEWELAKTSDWEVGNGGELYLVTKDNERFVFSPSFWLHAHIKNVEN